MPRSRSPKVGHPPHSNRRNSRNEAISLRALLVSACRVLEEYYPEMMPLHVKEWWAAHKSMTTRKREMKQDAEAARLTSVLSEMKEMDEDFDKIVEDFS
jgi:hypothetical protein